VRYAETDQMGVAYNAHFLTYFEVARTEYLRKLGTAYRDLEDKGFYLVVVEAYCKYLGPARYDDVLEVTTWVDRLRPTRIDFRHSVRRKAGQSREGAVAEGHVVLACVNRDRRPQALPPEVTSVIDVADGPLI
jgi:acyl-CoA thioester hydrolase